MHAESQTNYSIYCSKTNKIMKLDVKFKVHQPKKHKSQMYLLNKTKKKL